MDQYPNQLVEIIKDEFFRFFKNRFTQTPQFVDNPSFDDTNCMSARIILKGKNIHGVLAVNTTRNTLLQCHPERRYGDVITDEDLVDWIGEIVNRSLGNMKNRFFKYGIETTLNLPIHSSDAYKGDNSIKAPIISFTLSNGKEEVFIIFQAEISGDVNFEKTA